MKRGNQFLIKQSAVFMIFLIVTIPFVSALSITKVTVAGSQGIEDVMSSENDYFTAIVQTSEEVDADQLWISYTKDEAFDECSGTTCTYTSSRTDRSGQEMSYTIQLITQSMIDDEVEGTLLIDENPPEITEYAMEKSGDDITLSYEAEDTACDGCSGCAGIDYLSILMDDVETQQINVPSECSVDDELETSVSELNIADGDHEICMIAYDNVGLESDGVCEAVSVDSEAPYFETNSLQVLDISTNTLVKYIGGDAVLTTVKINVSDSSFEIVHADLSAFNAVIGSTYENVTGTCEQNYDDEAEYVCTWTNVYVEGVSGTIKPTFFAYDTGGNEKIYSPAYTITKDETAPTIIQAYNEAGGDELYLKSGTNSVYADFDPTGSAFSRGKAYLTLSLASLNKKTATACWENGVYWSCVWNFSMSYSGTSSSTLYIDAEDDAGNAMEQYDADVYTDSEEPEITSIIKSLDCPTGSDSLIIEINATDDSDELYATFYGEDIRTSNDPITEECSMVEEGVFTCLITVNDLVSYPEDEDAEIEVSDIAGNIADDDVSVSVCELEQSGTPNLVTTYIDDVSPVDKLTLSYIDYPLYVPISFSMTSGAHIVSKTASCEDASMYFIDQSETTTLAVLTIPKQSVANGTYSLREDCTISLTMQYGDNVYVNPEIENVTFDVELYGTPLGNIEESIGQKIEWQKIGIREAQGKIDNWVWTNRIFGFICTTSMNILTKANSIASIVHGIGAGLINIPAIYLTGVSIAKAMTLFDKFILKWVSFPGYGGWKNLGTYMKWICFIYSGKRCEGFNGLENEFAIKADEYGTDAYYEALFPDSSGVMTTQVPSAEKQGHYRLFYDWDPYKSIHTAKSCWYIDAYIYNLRKERQINCMYTKCLEENAKKGLPIEVCDIQFKERECLYVDGAAWLAGAAHTYFGHLLQLVLNTFVSNLDWGVYSSIYYSTCSGYILFQTPHAWTPLSIPKFDFYSLTPYRGTNIIQADMGLPTSQAYFAYCHALGSTITLVETDFLFKEMFNFDFKANLEGTDYCVGYE